MIYVIVIALIMWLTYSLATQYGYSEGTRMMVVIAVLIGGFLVPIIMFVVKQLSRS